MKTEIIHERSRTGAMAAAIIAMPLLALSMPTAGAHDMVAIDEAGNMVRFSDKNPNAIENVAIWGTSARLVGIDVRPSDGQLYGVATDGSIYRIDSGNGKVTPMGRMSIGNVGSITMVDFNPVADRLRVVTAEGRSLRVNVDTGETIEDGRLSYVTAKSFMVAAGGYTNSLKGATTTQLYQIDTANLALALQDPPNAGTLNQVNAIAMTGGTKDMKGGDVITDPRGVSLAYVVRGSRLYSIQIPSGQISLLGQIGPKDNVDFVDVAVVRQD